MFRPLSGPDSLPGPVTRCAAAELVRAHGSDTLSFFKLRADKYYFFSADRTAFVGYRVENGVLLLSGDPVGPESALDGLLSEVLAFAEVRGLRLGAVGASQRLCPIYERLGLRTLYLGDEAIIDLERFSLRGGPIRKVRQSDREPVPLQRQVLPALGAALPDLPGFAGLGADEPGGDVGRGPALQAPAAARSGVHGRALDGSRR